MILVAHFALHSNATTVSVDAVLDSLAEGTETFTVTIENHTLPASHQLSIPQASAVGTITDFDVDVQVSVSNASAQEGANLVFTVSMNVPAVVNMTVSYVYAVHGSATRADFTPHSDATVVIFAGTTSSTVTVVPTADGWVELEESFEIFLLAATPDSKINGHILLSPGTGTIENVDIASVVMSDGASREGECTPFTVTLSQPVADKTWLMYSVVAAGGGASDADGADVADPTVRFDFPAGEQNASLCVAAALTDALIEVDETFILALQSVNSVTPGYPALFETSQANGTGLIYHEVQVSIADASATEGTSLEFNVTLEYAVSSPVTVSYIVVQNGTATSEDYSYVYADVVFAAHHRPDNQRPRC
jgi:hypothetical protein